ncbi:hypothetical protein ES332_D12G049900v1 [Gossypium tomentosum]|uniref:Uncharacterized protein n=1 Tax=Gossypium tomentosum TaxID=34277 RepID=A0A5D2I6I8_GOSTO|nr:hypothetical protein ES332_D12G049900v1 [Gossypium tomentosum]
MNVSEDESQLSAIARKFLTVYYICCAWLQSKECLEKVTQTISFLAQPRESHLLLLTGEVQRDRAAELLGLRACNFRPRHSSKLGNEFRVFTNYDAGERLGGWEQEQ